MTRKSKKRAAAKKVFAVKQRQIGWAPLPLELKALFVFAALGLVSSLFGINAIAERGMIFLGASLNGASAAAITILVSWIGLGVLLLAMWKRHNWGWKYGTAYLSFIVLNRILVVPKTAGAAPQIVYYGAIAGTLVLAALLYLFYKNKDYFEK